MVDIKGKIGKGVLSALTRKNIIVKVDLPDLSSEDRIVVSEGVTALGLDEKFLSERVVEARGSSPSVFSPRELGKQLYILSTRFWDIMKGKAKFVITNSVLADPKSYSSGVNDNYIVIAIVKDEVPEEVARTSDYVISSGDDIFTLYSVISDIISFADQIPTPVV